jgi:hypothetical protein
MWAAAHCAAMQVPCRRLDRRLMAVASSGQAPMPLQQLRQSHEQAALEQRKVGAAQAHVRTG